MNDLDGLVDDLAGTRLGATFNQYAQTGGDDLGPEAPLIRREKNCSKAALQLVAM